MFHFDCIKPYFLAELDNGHMQIQCMICKKEINEHTLREAMTAKEFEKYQTMSLNLAQSRMPDSSWCPTPGCHYMFVKPEGEN